MAQEGVMVLWDGSVHQWFGAKHPPCCLISAIDDATSTVLSARFFPFEGTLGYLWCLKKIVDDHGIPLAIYQDRHGALHRNDNHWSLQDRLVAELGLEQIKSIDPANEFLQSTFINTFNQKFAIPPRQSQKAWRKVPKGIDLPRVISFHYTTTVANDNTVRIGPPCHRHPPKPNRRSYAKAKVEVRQLLDGSWEIYHNYQLIAQRPPNTITHQCPSSANHALHTQTPP